MPRTVLVNTTGNDGVDVDRNYTITHTVSTTDPNYLNVTAPSTLVRLIDDDVPGIVVTKRDLRVSEADVNDGTSYEVYLTSAPVGSVQITPVTYPVNQLIVIPQVLFFDAFTWNLRQVVNVQAADNADVDGEVVATIVHEIRAPFDQVRGSSKNRIFTGFSAIFLNKCGSLASCTRVWTRTTTT